MQHGSPDRDKGCIIFSAKDVKVLTGEGKGAFFHSIALGLVGDGVGLAKGWGVGEVFFFP